MAMPLKPGKKSVELDQPPRPSRIRRDPPPPANAPKAVRPYPTDGEVWTVVIGVILFALAISIIIFAVSDYTS